MPVVAQLRERPVPRTTRAVAHEMVLPGRLRDTIFGIQFASNNGDWPERATLPLH
jgi:hypothetical protein